ncbi:tol-pal system protein YbgF [Hydrogenophaga palleronii]|uniref:Cell division coordinator CpoB n=1 Tax=Hydrogenophaga palleronii TaxID=65655 RepID=A0ABU1WH77_9BURK|nr:tol-pal system protein YbgF [Hydrogenophaga palleronii]MDR7148620.1 tol-pal system protein YbgF [Hydrogenophaga palleronii]
MTHSMKRFSFQLIASGIAMASMLAPLQAQAFLGDDEARRAIIELRQRFEASEARQAKLAEEARSQGNTGQRSLLDLANQIEQLRSEVAHLRGQNEQLAREVSELQRKQKDVQSGLEERLKQVEPSTISLDGRDFTAAPAEQRDYEAAMAVLRRSEFPAAASAYASFLQRYPESGYTPSVLYWLGNAQYANRAYKEAIESHRRLISQFPGHQRVPEGMLALANSQVEMKDSKAARRTLEDLVKIHPGSEAASVARERLSRLR